MNDYKELIAELRKCKYCAPNISKYSADAIEQLVKERDAAVADSKGARSFPCRFCKKYHTESCDCYTAYYDKWEWRGVQEAEHES